MLRWFVLEAGLRGRGLGRRLIGELIEEVTAHRYRPHPPRDLQRPATAARIYRRHGFEVVHSETGPRWGRDEITYQHYELDLVASQSTSTTAPPRRGSPPPARAPSGSRATA